MHLSDLEKIDQKLAFKKKKFLDDQL